MTPTFEELVVASLILPVKVSWRFGVVVPIPTFPFTSIVRALMDEVAKVVGDEVAIYSAPPMERKVHGVSVSAPESASCGCVVEEMFSL